MNQEDFVDDDFVPVFDFGMDELMSTIPLEEIVTDERQPTETEIVETQDHSPGSPPPAQAYPAPAPPARVITDDDIHDFVVNSKAKNTTYKDTGGIKRLNTFMREINPDETRNFYELPKEDLDLLLCQFFMTAEKIDKKAVEKLYQPDTLNSFRNAWQRVISEKGPKFDIKTDPEFERSRKVLASRRKELTKLGMGNKPNATRPLEQEKVEKLYQSFFFWDH